MDRLIQTISYRISRYLEQAGLLVRDVENSNLQSDEVDDSAMADLLGHSITYRIAFGPQAGRKAFTLQTLPVREEGQQQSQARQGQRILVACRRCSSGPPTTP